MPSKTIEDFAYQVRDYMRSAEVVEGKNKLNVEVTTKLNRNGIDYTVNADKSITRYGTASGMSFLVLTGGGAITQQLDTDYQTAIIKAGEKIATLSNIQYRRTDGIYGNLSAGDIYTVEHDIGLFYISSTNGTQVDDTVYPMICTLADWNKSHTYEPFYVPLKDSMFKRSEQKVLGAKNLCDITKSASSASSITLSDTGFSATSTTGASFPYVRLDASHLTNGMEYIISFIVDSVSGNDTKRITLRNASNIVQQYVEITTAKAYEMKFTYVTGYRLDLFLGLIASTVGNDALTVSKVMIRLASDPDDTYSPYAMTNRELTDKLAIQESAFTDIISGASVTDNMNYLTKTGNVVSAWLILGSVTVASWTKIAGIPDGYRPKHDMYLRDAQSNKQFKISTAGNLSCADALSSASFAICFSWITP